MFNKADWMKRQRDMTCRDLKLERICKVGEMESNEQRADEVGGRFKVC